MLNRSFEPKLSFNSSINELLYNTDILANNIPLYSILDKSQEVCGIEIIFGGGKIDEITKGASYFSTNLLKSGIKEFDSNQINNFFELRGAFVQCKSGLDYNSLSLYCLTDKLKEVFPFFLRLFTEPIFPKEKLDKLKATKKQELEINEQKSSYWANKLLKTALFNNHPYGQLLGKENIQSITTNQLKKHWKTNSLRNIKFITTAGNFNKANLISVIEKSLDAQPIILKTSDAKSIFESAGSSINKSLKNNNQSSLKIGFTSLNPTNAFYPNLSFANTILGGYFGSRLMQSIREDKGLTYGIGSSIQHLEQESYVQISADVKKGAGKEVIELINIELEKLTSITIPESELVKVRSYLIGEHKSNAETIFDKINKVKFLKLKQLPDTYFINHFDSILKLSSSEIQKVVAENFNPQYFKTILIE